MKNVGVLVPIISIFNEDESINEKATRDHVNFLIDHGVHGLLAGGTCTEFSSMSDEERIQIAEIIMDEVKGRIPVYVGVAHPGTSQAIKFAKHAEEIGATGIFSVPPYYMLPTEEEMIQYFKDVSASVNIPLMIYNNPGLSGVGLSVPTIAELTNSGVATLVKECYGDPARIQDLTLKCNKDIAIIYGEDYGAFQGLMIGADGWTAGVGNFMPKECVELWNLLKVEKDYEAALNLWYKILPIINMTSKKEMYGKPDGRPDFVQIYKAALNMMGRIGGNARKPLSAGLMQDMGFHIQQDMIKN